MAEKSLSVRIAAVDAASSVFKKVGAEVDALARKADRAGGAGKGGGIFAGLKESLGEESQAGQFVKLLQGAGAVAAFTGAGLALERMTDAAAKFRSEFESGEKSAAELAGTLIQSLPIVGGFAKAGANIRDLLTGEQAAIKRITEEAELTNQAIETQRALLKRVEESHKESLATVRQIRNEAELLGKTEPNRSLIGLRQEGEEFRIKTLDDAKKQGEQVVEADKALRKKLNGQLTDALRAEGDAIQKAKEARARADSTVRQTLQGPRNLEPDAAAAKKAADDAIAHRKAVKNLIDELDRREAQAKAQIDRDAQQKLAEQEALIEQKRLEVLKQFNKARAAEIDAAEQKIADASLESRQSYLRILGKSYQAELEGLRVQHKKRLDEIDRAAREEAERHPEDAAGIAARAFRARGAEDERARFAEFELQEKRRRQRADGIFNLRQSLLSAGRDVDDAVAGPLGTLKSLLFGDPSKRLPPEPARFAAFADEGFTSGIGLSARAAANRVDPLVEEQRKANNFLQQYLPSLPRVANLMDRMAQVIDRLERKFPGSVYSGPQ